MEEHENRALIKYNPHAPGMRNGKTWLLILLSVCCVLYFIFQVTIPNQRAVELLAQQKEEVYTLESAPEALMKRKVAEINHQTFAVLGIIGAALSSMGVLAAIFSVIRSTGNIVISNDGIKLDNARKVTFWTEISAIDFSNQTGLPNSGEIIFRTDGNKTVRVRLAGLSDDDKALLIHRIRTNPKKLQIPADLPSIESN